MAQRFWSYFPAGLISHQQILQLIHPFFELGHLETACGVRFFRISFQLELLLSQRIAEALNLLFESGYFIFVEVNSFRISMVIAFIIETRMQNIFTHFEFSILFLDFHKLCVQEIQRLFFELKIFLHFFQSLGQSFVLVSHPLDFSQVGLFQIAYLKLFLFQLISQILQFFLHIELLLFFVFFILTEFHP